MLVSPQTYFRQPWHVPPDVAPQPRSISVEAREESDNSDSSKLWNLTQEQKHQAMNVVYKYIRGRLEKRFILLQDTDRKNLCQDVFILWAQVAGALPPPLMDSSDEDSDEGSSDESVDEVHQHPWMRDAIENPDMPYQEWIAQLRTLMRSLPVA